MKVHESLSLEQELLILLSRVTFSEKDVSRIREILKETTKVNWFEFYKLSLYHKTTTLVNENLKKYICTWEIPKYLRDIIKYAYKGIKEKNTLYHDEIEKIVKELRKEGVCIVPVKGAMLIPQLYKDYGIRYSADADFLVKHSDIEKLKTILKKFGYMQGNYDSETDSIIPLSRAEEIRWKMNMSNLYPFVKKSNHHLFNVYRLDFRYALDDTLDQEPINQIVDYAYKTGQPKPAHILTHLCTHFYDEAKYSISIYSAKDMNIIKLCDIREYVLNFMNVIDIEECIEFAKTYNLQKQVYYTMFFLDFVYSDSFATKIMEMLEIENESFLHTYGENSLNDQFVIEKTFFDRLFSCHNVDTLKKRPSLLNDFN